LEAPRRDRQFQQLRIERLELERGSLGAFVIAAQRIKTDAGVIERLGGAALVSWPRGCVIGQIAT